MSLQLSEGVTAGLKLAESPLHYPRNPRVVFDADLYDFYDFRCSERGITIIKTCVFQRRKTGTRNAKF